MNDNNINEWEARYYDVADAICRESTGVEDLMRQARKLRDMAFYTEHAVSLLCRWSEWARMHGHDIGIADDTRDLLRTIAQMSARRAKGGPDHAQG
jgi:predicted butyrate kinase (DUF1464 family)